MLVEIEYGKISQRTTVDSLKEGQFFRFGGFPTSVYLKTPSGFIRFDPRDTLGSPVQFPDPGTRVTPVKNIRMIAEI